MASFQETEKASLVHSQEKPQKPPRMDTSKNSNKISDIVKLKQMLKKWRKQAHSSSANPSNNNDNNSNSNKSSSNSSKKGSLSRSNSSNNNSKKGSLSRSNSKKGITFLKRTLSFTDVSTAAAPSNGAVPKGFLAVLVGEEMKRFVIPTNYLSHQAFCVLLKEAEEEFGFQQEGILRIPCDVEMFESILKMVEAKNKNNLQSKQALRFSRNDGIVCGSTESQSMSQSYPPSPMCR